MEASLSVCGRKETTVKLGFFPDYIKVNAWML
jgi:hypothetical protein